MPDFFLDFLPFLEFVDSFKFSNKISAKSIMRYFFHQEAFGKWILPFLCWNSSILFLFAKYLILFFQLI